LAKDIDWAHIRTEYEETTKSVRMIARENNITHGAIQRTAKLQGWKKFSPDGVVNDRALVGKNPILGKIALRKMNELIYELGENYSALDEPLVAIYASNYELWIEQMMIVKEEGLISISSKGSEYLSANFSALLPLQKSMITIANHLGLSISSRKRIGMTTKVDPQESSLFDIGSELNEYYLDV
jgi:P27 family predicted phage terminase small subunit